LWNSGGVIGGVVGKLIGVAICCAALNNSLPPSSNIVNVHADVQAWLLPAQAVRLPLGL